MKSVLRAVAAIAALMSGSALAADLPVKAPPLVIEVFNRAGFYAGANLGYSFGRSSNAWDVFSQGNVNAPGAAGPPADTVCPSPGGGGGAFCASGNDSSKLNGWIGGFQAGYNWLTARNYVIGLEGDFQFSGQKHDQVFTAINPTNGTLFGNPVTGTVTAPYSEKLSWLSTVRGRIGYAGDRWLVYATGGLAVGQVKFDGFATAIGAPQGNVGCAPINPVAGTCALASISNSVTKAGWTLGAGIEGAFAGNWSWKVEYLHVDLGTVNSTFSTVPGCFGGFAESGRVSGAVFATSCWPDAERSIAE